MVKYTGKQIRGIIMKIKEVQAFLSKELNNHLYFELIIDSFSR